LEYEDAIHTFHVLRDAGLPVTFGGNMFLDIPWVWEGSLEDDGWRWRLKADALREEQTALLNEVLGGQGLKWRRMDGGNGDYITVYRPGYRKYGAPRG
jgi:hypothetical protein